MSEPHARIIYNFEYERHLRVCYIGAGGHSYRNVLPTFQYAPIDLVAICDREIARAEAYARQFGARRFYDDHRAMLAAEQPDAVFIVTSYTPEGRVQATELALDALRAGAHVWMEKPTAASSAEVRELMRVAAETGRSVMTGLKKIFFPTLVKAREIITSPEFGRPSSIYVRYPQSMPPHEERRDLRNVTGLLDHLPHPAAILNELMGPIERCAYEWEPINGGSLVSMRFVSGAIGMLHLSAGASGSAPLERLEVIGEGANLVVDNGVRLTYYRRARRPAYGRSASFLVEDEAAPLVWEPEFSLGQLYNKNIFLLGYVQEVLHFCDSVLAGREPTGGTLAQALEIARLFEALCATPPGTMVTINPATT